ncbi:MAG: SDR family NAD(P)-dependent oxidoreductase [Streptosporangiales bacterium]|nr:SDR family NAD(P)-dependent oxidoreductase [Streptosporangiales bacterium]
MRPPERSTWSSTCASASANGRIAWRSSARRSFRSCTVATVEANREPVRDARPGVLTGHLALVTGAAGGIGQALAEAYANAGANLILLGRDLTKLRAMARRPVFAKRRVTTVALDVSAVHSVEVLRSALRSADDRYPDILINNAGIGQGAGPRPVRSVLDVTPEFWDRMFDTDVRGPLLLMQALIPEMVRAGTGSILNITSRLAYRSVPGTAPYGPAKAAMDQLTRVVAKELEHTGVRANLLHPGGPIRTGIFSEAWPVPAGSVVADPAIMGPPAVWLATPAAAGVSGKTIDARTWQHFADGRRP